LNISSSDELVGGLDGLAGTGGADVDDGRTDGVEHRSRRGNGALLDAVRACWRSAARWGNA